MGICWYCHWGWPEQVAEIYRLGVERSSYVSMHYGPGHVVWDDENFETVHINWFIENAQGNRGDLSDGELAVVIESLTALLAVPEDIRCCEPADYDEENPDNYPPPGNLQMIKKRELATGS